MIRLVVVDDHTLVRSGLVRLLEGEDGFEVVGQTGSGHEAISLARSLEPDVILLDYSLPDLDGMEATRQIAALGGRTRILILTMYASEEYATRLVQSGASGFIVKSSSTDDMLGAIRKVAAGGVYLSPEIMERMATRIAQAEGVAPESGLSNREIQVLVRLARGSTTKEVSRLLNLSPSTVETYRSRILEKLGLRNNSDITRFAIRRGLIDLD